MNITQWIVTEMKGNVGALSWSIDLPSRWKDNIKMDLQEVWCRGHGLDLSGSGQRQVVGTCECSNEPLGYTKCREFLG
jgi:hypothetical protein